MTNITLKHTHVFQTLIYLIVLSLFSKEVLNFNFCWFDTFHPLFSFDGFVNGDRPSLKWVSQPELCPSHRSAGLWWRREGSGGNVGLHPATGERGSV